MRTALFIPCFNVESSILRVLQNIKPEILEKFEEILLIDNGSGDQTVPLIKAFIKNSGSKKFTLFQNTQNYSLGGSTIIAIRESLAKGYDFLICLHSDGQADPSDLVNFFPLDPLEDFVFGSRMLKASQTADYSFTRKCGNLFFARLQQLILRQKIFDIGAFVAFNLTRLAHHPYAQIPHDMGYQPNLVLYLATKKKLRCREFPISWGPVESSHVNIWHYGIIHLIRLLKMSLGFFPLTDKKPIDFVSTLWNSNN